MLLVMDKHDIENFDIIDELNLISKGDILVDVGANMGEYTNKFLSLLDGAASARARGRAARRRPPRHRAPVGGGGVSRR